MLDFLKSDDDAINILKTDHEKVKGLFDQFEKADSLRQKKKIVAEALMELKIHATIEEEIFYPAIRRNREVETDLMNKADEEHHVAKLLIAELDQMDGSEEHFEAKFHVLSENIRHHIKEEEGKMIPEARETKIDFIALGQQLLMRKQQLMKNGVPASSEEKMISRNKGKADSPARTAKSMAQGKGKSAKGSYSSGSAPMNKRNSAPRKARPKK
jgi:hypothetical protein